MNKNDLLYRYFSDSLSKAEEMQLEELLKKDIDFATQFEFENNLRRVVKEKRNRDLKSKLNQFETEINTEKYIQKKSFPYLKIAASILILVAAGWFGYYNFFEVNYTELYSENYNTYPNTVYTITRSDAKNSLEREAFVAYEAEDYKLAIEKFETAEPKAYFKFYKAQSYLKLKNYDKAKQHFKYIIKENKQFVAESHWYLALIYIRQKDKENALIHLNSLVNNYAYKASISKRLIQKLD